MVRASAGRPRRARFRDTSRGRLAQNLVHPLAQPPEAVRLHGLWQPGLRDQHVVAAGRDALEALPPGLTQLALDPIARDRIPGCLRHCKTQSRLARIVFTVEPIEDE